ncbi:competence type IV pilus minor pilin ComGF [Paenisporosarcina cavernae]|uniref:Competence protein ComGF n=1 Tax=Paenisporosarcina cavernae TaxID=2320858 RepID=A0A385YST8_9BACL|nr:competence type IV pilus minor pilin ComGF [Paenisporosarcina cavernae]AYC29561.1 hypothetical protein D3873_06570 [Paenisporosarcina cavernae]
MHFLQTRDKRTFFLPSVLTQKGFTLIESILQFSIFLFVVATLPTIFHFLGTTNNLLANNQEQQWDLFLMDTRNYLDEQVNVIVINQSSGIRITTINESYDIELNGNEIRKQRNQLGNEPMLLHVKAVTFTKYGHEIRLRVKKNSGEIYEQSFQISG